MSRPSSASLNAPPAPETEKEAEVAAGGDGDPLPGEEDVTGLLPPWPHRTAEPRQRRSSREEEEDEEGEEGEERRPGGADLFAAVQQAVSSLERAVFSRHGRPPALGHEWARAAKALREALGRRDEELSRASAALAALRHERDRLQRRARELQDALSSIETPCGGSPVLCRPPAPSSAARDPLRRARSYHGAVSRREPPATPPTEPERRLQQLQGHLERLRAANQLLSVALHDCKSHSERLSMVLGQHEAQGTALRLALHCSERCVDAYGALLALTRAKLHPGTSSGESHPGGRWDAACGMASPGAGADEGSLRERIRQLRAEQAAVQASLCATPVPAGTLARHSEDIRARAERALQDAQPPLATPVSRPELDKAELLLELATLKEAMADLQVQLQLEKTQKRGLEVLAAAQGPREDALRLLLLHLQWGGGPRPALVLTGARPQQDAEPGCTGAAAPMDPAGTTQELLEALARSEDLRARTQALLRALEQASTESHVQHVHCSALARDFCHAHSALALAYRGARRRQEAQLRRRQAQAAALAAQQEQQAQALARRLARLEQLHAPAATSTSATSTSDTTTSETCI
ncbi:Usher syndrome type-1C protein-binding protein 1 [Nothoprocta perdicaria]|uniref:Usher syndrome type-1C protein-binding protein 1 n=1 Tax=Nothoprocta perdicaria TaxID=30464 RepID=UPI000E1B5B4A|nr:Usher syndrome type-1C protein-binding protein 1 [Nothoprocta perdicaria]